MGKLDGLHWKEVERVALHLGFEFKRQKGSHRIYKKPGHPKLVTLPMHKSLKTGTLRKGIINNLGITVDEFIDILE